jgi:hypothetical protein
MAMKSINLVMFAGKDAADNNGLWVTNGTAIFADRFGVNCGSAQSNDR